MKKCEHGYYLGPNGEHIIPKDQAVPIADIAKKHYNDYNNLIVSGPYAQRKRNTQQYEEPAKTYTIIKHEEPTKPEKTTAELIEEAKKLFQNTTTKPVTPVRKDATIQEFKRALGLK